MNVQPARTPTVSMSFLVMMTMRITIMAMVLLMMVMQTSYLSLISRIISVEKILSCGEISDFCKEFEQFMEFFLSKFMPFFVQICVEKNLAQKCVCGEKMTNIRYAQAINK